MKLLLVSQYFWPESFRINEVVQALKDEGVDVVVLTGQPNYPQGETYKGYRWWRVQTDWHEGIEVIRVPLLPRGKRSALGLVLNYFSFVFFASVCGPWLLRRRTIDKVLVFGTSPILQAIPAILLARLKRAQLITWVQDLWPESLSAAGYVKNRRVLALVEKLVRWIYRSNDLLLVQSKAFVAPVQGMSGSTSVRYHPNPGDFAFSDSQAFKAEAPVFAGNFSVVFAGNLGTVQALETVLDAAELLIEDPDTSIVLVGDGSRADWVKTEINRRGLANVKMPGRFPLSMMPAIMKNSSVMLVSLIRSEIMGQTVPSKIQAYLAAGKPIIAALDGEGARVVLEAGAGVACPAEDAVALAQAIRALKNSPSGVLQEMGKKARCYYDENFEPRRLARQMIDHLSAAGGR